MARLPVPGADQGSWGDVLNEYLLESHNPDGTQKAGSISAGAVQNGAISEAKLDSALQTKINSGSTAGVTSVNTRTGAVTLAKADVGLANVDDTSDAAKPVSTATQAALDGKLALSGGTLTGNLNVTAGPGTNPISLLGGNFPSLSVRDTATGAMTTQWISVPNSGSALFDYSGDLAGTFDIRNRVNDSLSTVVRVNAAGQVYTYQGINVAGNRIEALGTPTSNGDAANKEYVDTRTNGLVSGTGINSIVAVTQAEYDALTPDAATLYVIRG